MGESSSVSGVRFVDSIVVTPEMRVAASGLIERLGSFTVHSSMSWRPLAEALDLDQAASTAGAALVVGSPADILKHAAGASSEFGFIVAVAQVTRWWQRTPSWRDETMLDLWSNGWTPVAIDRVVTAKQDAGIEFAIGNARPTPTVMESGES